MSTESWHSPDAYHYATVMEYPELAWEFLRRSPDYQMTYDKTPTVTDTEADRLARDWGLRIRR